MMKVAVVGLLMLGLSACDSGKWVDVPSPGCVGTDGQQEMWGKAVCLQIQKTYAGELRCEGGKNLQVKCK
jgi:hypothetical protein